MNNKKKLNEDLATITNVAFGIMLYKTTIAVLGLVTLGGVYGLLRGGLALYERNYHKCVESLKDFCTEFIHQLPPEHVKELKSMSRNNAKQCIKNALETAATDKNPKISKNAKTLLKFFDKHIVNGPDMESDISFSEIIADALK